MSFLIAVFGYPLILLILSVGAGLLVEWAAGRRLPVALLPAAGFAALIVLSQIIVLSGATAPLTPIVLVVLAGLGYAVGLRPLRERWRQRSPGRWSTPVAGAVSYLATAMPLIASGRLTFPGYLIDTTGAIQLQGGEWILHHGVHLPPPAPAYGAVLDAYFGNGYPTGGQVLLAGSGWLSGQDLLWLSFPFQAFGVGLGAMGLTFLARRAGLSRLAAGFAGAIASLSALVYAYALMGSIKELTFFPLMVLLAGLAVTARVQLEVGLRGAIPFVVGSAGAVAAIGPSAAAWVVLFAVVGLFVARREVRMIFIGWHQLVRSGRTAALTTAGIAVGLVLVVVVATAGRVKSSIDLALSLSGSNAPLANDPGNLLHPLRYVQAFGVWLGGSHRVDPKYVNTTYVLIGLVIVCCVLGIFWLLRRRAWAVLALLGAVLIAFVALNLRGTTWTDAKVLMLTSPFVVLVALVGALGRKRGDRGARLLLAGTVAVAVLASDALLYHGTPMAPTARFTELRSIGQRFAGQGPTYLPDFDEYALYLLRKEAVDSPGFSSHGTFGVGGYGHSFDVDQINLVYLRRFNLVVARRSPRWSRPPGYYSLVWQGHYYDVWRRTSAPPLAHVALGAGLQPVAIPSCALIRSVAQRAARSHAQLRYAARQPNALASLTHASVSFFGSRGTDADGFPMVTFTAPGTVTSHVTVPARGDYVLWLGGDVDRQFTARIDGHYAGSASHQSGGDGNMIRIGPVNLSAGRHRVEVARGGGGLEPGNDSGNLIDGIFSTQGVADAVLVATIAPSTWRSLCGRPLDWIEVT
jgi:hypothetical protein